MLYIRPSQPAYGDSAALYTQPEMIIGNVIQFGTFSFRPSMTAATISVSVTTQIGQLSNKPRVR